MSENIFSSSIEANLREKGSRSSPSAIALMSCIKITDYSDATQL